MLDNAWLMVAGRAALRPLLRSGVLWIGTFFLSAGVLQALLWVWPYVWRVLRWLLFMAAALILTSWLLDYVLDEGGVFDEVNAFILQWTGAQAQHAYATACRWRRIPRLFCPPSALPPNPIFE